MNERTDRIFAPKRTFPGEGHEKEEGEHFLIGDHVGKQRGEYKNFGEKHQRESVLFFKSRNFGGMEEGALGGLKQRAKASFQPGEKRCTVEQTLKDTTIEEERGKQKKRGPFRI